MGSAMPTQGIWTGGSTLGGFLARRGKVRTRPNPESGATIAAATELAAWLGMWPHRQRYVSTQVLRGGVRKFLWMSRPALVSSRVDVRKRVSPINTVLPRTILRRRNRVV